jgi:hypothetical protein
MLLLFWLLPFTIMSGAYDTLYRNEASKRQDGAPKATLPLDT